MFKSIREWSSDFTTPFAEALKEAFRVVLFSIPGQLVMYLEDTQGIWKVLVVNLLLIFLRALDKYLYEASKDRGQKQGEVVGGLSPI